MIWNLNRLYMCAYRRPRNIAVKHPNDCLSPMQRLNSLELQNRSRYRSFYETSDQMLIQLILLRNSWNAGTSWRDMWRRKKRHFLFNLLCWSYCHSYCSVLTLHMLRLTRNIYFQSISATERERKIMQRHQAVDTAVAMMSLFGDKSDDSDEHDISRMHFQSCM